MKHSLSENKGLFVDRDVENYMKNSSEYMNFNFNVLVKTQRKKMTEKPAHKIKFCLTKNKLHFRNVADERGQARPLLRHRPGDTGLGGHQYDQLTSGRRCAGGGAACKCPFLIGSSDTSWAGATAASGWPSGGRGEANRGGGDITTELLTSVWAGTA